MKKIILATALTSCCFAFAQEYMVANIPAELKKNANTVIRLHSSQYTLNKVDDLNIKVKEVKSILTKAGERNSAVAINYDRYNKISNIKVRVIDEFGKVSRTYSKKDFQDVSGTGSSGLYTDDRVLYLGITSVIILIRLMRLMKLILLIQLLFRVLDHIIEVTLVLKIPKLVLIINLGLS